MTINKDALSEYLERREEEGFVEEVESEHMDRLVYTENGVAKIREIEAHEDAEEIYRIVRDNFETVKERNIDHINTSYTLLEDYRGENALAVFQPYTEESREDLGKWGSIANDATRKGVILDARPDNFGLQYSKAGEPIRYGFRDFSDSASVSLEDRG